MEPSFYPVMKFAADSRDIRRVDLPHGVKCLLISEPDELLAQLLLCADRGLFDGIEIASMKEAFISSQKFKRFEDFIKLNNGAVHLPKIETDLIIFGFEVHISALSLAAKKIAELLITPELGPLICRKLTFDNNFARTPENEALAALLGKSHQFSKLMNRYNSPLSLTEDGTEDYLAKLLETSQWSLLLIGAQGAEQLFEIASKFDFISSKERTLSKCACEKEQNDRINKVVVICSTEFTKLVVTWLMDSKEDDFENVKNRCKPLNYIQYLLQQEGEGGLLETLRKQGLITDLQALISSDSFESNNCWNVFRVVFALTPKGVEQKSQILSALKSYLEFSQANEVQECIYEEAAMRMRLTTEFGEVNKPTNPWKLCKNVLRFSPEDCLLGCDLMFEYSKEAIHDTFTRLITEKYNVILEGDLDISKFEEAQSENFGLLLQMPDLVPSSSFNFQCYKGNSLMPKHLKLVEETRFIEDYPNMISKSDSHRGWYQFRQTKTPKARFFIHFDIHPSTAEMSISAETACAVLERQIFNRQISQAGIEICAQPSNSGVSISIVAFNENLKAFSLSVAQKLTKFQLDEVLFTECLADLAESYQMRNTNAGYAENIFGQMYNGDIDMQLKINAVRKCSKEMVFKYVRGMAASRREYFLFGNYGSNDGLELMEDFENAMTECAQQHKIQLPIDQNHHLLRSNSFEDRLQPGVSKKDYSVMLVYYHWISDLHGLNTICMELLVSILMVELQTEATVNCMCRYQNQEATGFTIEITSNADHLSRLSNGIEKNVFQITEWIVERGKDFYELFAASKNQLNRTKGHYVSNPMNVEAETHFNEIVNNTFCFGRSRFDISTRSSNLEADDFCKWIKLSLEKGCLRKPVCRIRVA